MVVARTGHQQVGARRAALLDKLQQARAVFRGVLAVVHLHAGQARIHQLAQVLQAQGGPAHRAHGVRDDRHAAGLADQAHRLHRVQGLLGHVVGAARVEQAVEGLGAVPHDSGGDQRVGDVRAAHGGVALPHLREHVVPGQRVVGGQALEDGAGATLAAEANLLHAVCKL